MRTWKSTSMGGRAHACRLVVAVSSAIAVSVHSAPPCRRGILGRRSPRQERVRLQGGRGARTYFQMITFSSGTYFPLPVAHLTSTVVVFSGVGIRRTMSVALSLLLNVVRTATVYSTLDRPCSTTIGWIRRGRFTLVVDRYLNGHSQS